MFWERWDDLTLILFILFSSSVLEFFKGYLGLQNLKVRTRILSDRPEGALRTRLAVEVGLLEVLMATIDGCKVVVVARMRLICVPFLGLGIGIGTGMSSKFFKPISLGSQNSRLLDDSDDSPQEMNIV